MLGAIGGIIAILGAALPWQQTVADRLEVDAFDIPVRFLGGWDEIAAGGFAIGLAHPRSWRASAPLVSMIAGGGIVRRILGVRDRRWSALVYVLQQQDWLTTNDRGLGTGLNVWDIVDYGVAVTFGGGLLMVFAPSR